MVYIYKYNKNSMYYNVFYSSTLLLFYCSIVLLAVFFLLSAVFSAVLCAFFCSTFTPKNNWLPMRLLRWQMIQLCMYVCMYTRRFTILFFLGKLQQ